MKQHARRWIGSSNVKICPTSLGGWPGLRLARLSALLVALGMVAMVLSGGCRGCSQHKVVVVYTSVDQVDAQPIFRYCSKKTGIEVRGLYDTEETKSTGVFNRLIAERNHPQADLFWSGDPVRSALLIRRGIVVAYRPKAASDLPAVFRAADGTWTGVAARARILLVNKALVPADQMPTSILDMVDPKWKGKVAMASPLYGATTMHVAALASIWGEAKTRTFMDRLKANGVKIVGSNGEVKRLVVAGQVAFGLTDTEDAAEALRDRANVAVVFPDQQGMGTVVMPSTVVLIKGAPHAKLARKLLECLVSKDVERRLVDTGSYLPLRPDVKVPKSKRGVCWPASLKRTNVDYKKAADALEHMQPFLRKWSGL